MKFKFLAAILFFFAIHGGANALTVTTQQNGPIQNACAVSVDFDIYGNSQYQLKDAFNSDSAYIISSQSKVEINTLGNKASIDPNFSQPSNYAPGAGSFTVAWQNGKTKLNLASLVPADRGTTIAQVLYKIRRVPLGPGVTPNVELIAVPDLGPSVFPGPAVSYGINQNSFNPSAAFEDVECLNIKPRWCGDGIIDNDKGETCDNGAQNGTAGNACSATCTPSANPTFFDVSLKKYVNSVAPENDAQTPATAISIESGKPYQYVFRVTNNGPSATSTATAVSDVSFPAGITLQSVPSGNGWSCGLAIGGFTCTRPDSLASGASFPDITATVIHSGALPAAALRNDAYVVNVNENPANNFGNNNTDPAHVNITPSTNPCVPGPTTGVQPASLYLLSPGLCPGTTVAADFSELRNPSTGIFNYAWSCNGSAVGGACTASFNPNGTTGFDLSLKKYVNSTAQDAQDGNAVSLATSAAFNYVIRVTNNGVVTATGTTTVSDPGPATGVDFVGTPSGTGWACSTAGRGITCTRNDSLAVGASFPDITVPATTTAANGTFRNLASVSNPNENPFSNFGNNNTDPANVTTGGGGSTPACATLTSSVTAAQTVSTYSSTLNCTAAPAAGASPTFQINCGNGQVINAATGTCNYTAFGTNAAYCSVNSQTGASIPNSCRVNISSFPPGGGGGGPGSCQELAFSPVSNVGGIYSASMSCAATSAAGPSPTIEIDCGNGKTLTGSTGICQYSTGPGSNFPYTATCRVNGSTQGAPSSSPGIFAPGSCRQSISFAGGAPLPPGGGGSSAYCGNGVVDSWTKTISWSAPIPGATCTAINRTEIQRVNGVDTSVQVLDHYSCIVTTHETCDAGTLYGAPINNAMCTNCNFTLGTSTNPRANPLFLSYYPADTSRPRGLPVDNYQWIIGNDVPVFDSGDRFTITSPFPTILSGYSATMENSSSLLSPSSATVSNAFGSAECIGAGSVDFGTSVTGCTQEKTVFTVGAGGRVVSATGNSGRTFVGNSAGITSAAADVNPPLSAGSAVLQNNFTIGIGYLREPLRVRVSRQAVSNTAGGNAYIGSQVGYSVNSITKEFLTSIETGNFVVTSSSKTNDISLSGADGSTGSKSAEGIKVGAVATTNGSVNATIRSMADFNFAQFSKMGDAQNIYVLHKGTVTIEGDLVLQGIGTLLIEEGTLVINGNVTYADANSSWAFVVVKPGSTGVAINVKNTVETISGVYMALEGKMSGSAASITQLAVDGNVYANLSELVNSRTFIRATEGSSALSTGVTINYSTRAFKNPPPLLSKYLEQYTLKKISR